MGETSPLRQFASAPIQGIEPFRLMMAEPLGSQLIPIAMKENGLVPDWGSGLLTLANRINKPVKCKRVYSNSVFVVSPFRDKHAGRFSPFRTAQALSSHEGSYTRIGALAIS